MPLLLPRPFILPMAMLATITHIIGPTTRLFGMATRSIFTIQAVPEDPVVREANLDLQPEVSFRLQEDMFKSRLRIRGVRPCREAAKYLLPAAPRVMLNHRLQAALAPSPGPAALLVHLQAAAIPPAAGHQAREAVLERVVPRLQGIAQAAAAALKRFRDSRSILL